MGSFIRDIDNDSVDSIHRILRSFKISHLVHRWCREAYQYSSLPIGEFQEQLTLFWQAVGNRHEERKDYQSFLSLIFFAAILQKRNDYDHLITMALRELSLAYAGADYEEIFWSSCSKIFPEMQIFQLLPAEDHLIYWTGDAVTEEATQGEEVDALDTDGEFSSVSSSSEGIW